MCDVLLPPGVNPTAVKYMYIISYISYHIRDHEGPEGEWIYSFTFFSTSAVDGVDGQRHAQAALPPGKSHYPLYRRLGGPQGRYVRVRKISPPAEIRSPDRPAWSESLYRLSYPGPQLHSSMVNLQGGAKVVNVNISSSFSRVSNI
jgi:hypothetical protein